MRLGFIGTGTMGNPMVRCLLEAGHQVAVNDLNREATTGLCERGATWAGLPIEVAQESQVVFTSLPTPAAVEQVMLHPETGALAGLSQDSAFIDMTSNSPTVVRRLADVCRQKGVHVLDAPVSGRPPGMTIMVGGDRAVFDQYLPVLENMGSNIFYVGGTGTGCVAKLVTQYLGYCNFITAAEGLLIGAKAGIDLNTLAQIVPVSAGASRTFENIPRSVFDGSFVSGGSLDIVAKDLDLACQMAREAAAPSRMGAIADEFFKRAQAQGWGQDGYPSVVKILEQMAGAQLRTESVPDNVGYQQHDPRRG
ncbi:MAG: hypothetical protein BZY80_05080 [SAR202 cluster bacterium Io17-Chloro-G2]|nr:MAG: hypothetical protein BZY80_05080 [SAR202 cluster bacterium Io17-Chloro-G2]